MTWGATAIGAATFGSALLGAGAAKSSAKTIAGGANAANQLQSQIYQQNLARTQPYTQFGTEGLSRYTSALPSLTTSFTGANLANDPGYKFSLEQGLIPVQNQLNRTGSLYGGNALKGIEDYGIGRASTTFQQAASRDLANRQFTAGLYQYPIGVGESSATGQNALGTGYANAFGNNLTGAADATAAGTVGATNALTSGLSGYLTYDQQQQQLKQNQAYQAALTAMFNRSGYGSEPYNVGIGAPNTPSNPNAFYLPQ